MTPLSPANDRNLPRHCLEPALKTMDRRAGFLVDAQDVEDLTQETWLRALTVWDSFRGDSLRSTWMSGILRRTARDVRRPRTVVSLDSIHEPASRERSIDHEIENRQRTAMLKKAIGTLAPHYRAAIREWLQGTPYRQIEKSLLWRAKCQLKKKVALLERKHCAQNPMKNKYRGGG